MQHLIKLRLLLLITLSLDTINTIIYFIILATFPTVANIIIVAMRTDQPILANILILSTNSSLYAINIIGCDHI